VDKNQFLAQTARPVTISGLSVHDIKKAFVNFDKEDEGLFASRLRSNAPRALRRKRRSLDVTENHGRAAGLRLYSIRAFIR
jgi:hypothetical protein